MNNFHYVSVLLDQLYGLEMENEDIEELGLIAWGLIGNKNTKLYRFCTYIGPDKKVQLPCNVVEIEAITTDFEDWKEVTNYSEQGDNRTAFTEQYIEATKRNRNPFYISGKFVKYEQVGDILYFTENYGKINILYKGIVADDEGLPELTDKEATAIATYLAYISKYKEGLKTNNGNIIQLANTLELKWHKQCDQARVTYLNQNDMNEILNVKDSWNRHTFGYSYKPLR